MLFSISFSSNNKWMILYLINSTSMMIIRKQQVRSYPFLPSLPLSGLISHSVKMLSAGVRSFISTGGCQQGDGHYIYLSSSLYMALWSLFARGDIPSQYKRQGKIYRQMWMYISHHEDLSLIPICNLYTAASRWSNQSRREHWRRMVCGLALAASHGGSRLVSIRPYSKCLRCRWPFSIDRSSCLSAFMAGSGR